MLFSLRLVKEAGHQVSVWRNGFSAHGANALDPNLADRIAVRAAGNHAALVGNVHRPENFAVHVLAFLQAGAAHRTVDQGGLLALRGGPLFVPL